MEGIFFNPNNSVFFATKGGSIFIPTTPQGIEKIEKSRGKAWNQIYNEEAKKIKRKFKYGEGSFGVRINPPN